MTKLHITNLHPGDRVYVGTEDGYTAEGMVLHNETVPVESGASYPASLSIRIPPFIGKVIVRVIALTIKWVEYNVPITPDVVNYVHIERIPDPVYSYFPSYSSDNVSSELLELEKLIQTLL